MIISLKIDPSGDHCYNLPKKFLILQHQLSELQWERLLHPEDLFISLYTYFSLFYCLFAPK